jgi:hypothetical protein
MRRLLFVIPVLLLVPFNASSAQAQQDTLSVAARLVMRQPLGIVLRVTAANEQVTGVLERVDAGSIYLGEPERVLPLSAVTDAWLQRRATRRGGKVGAIVGASAGAVTFGFGIAFLSALCEYDCDDYGAGEIAVATLLGGVLGGGAGYLVGSLIGASVPRWERLTESSAPPTVVAGGTRRHPGLSAFSVVPLATHAAARADGVGGGVGIAYLSQLSRHFALGPEVAIYDVNVRTLTTEFECGLPDGELCTITQEGGGSWSAGGLGRLGMGADRAFEPYAVLGFGVYQFVYNINLGGYSAGAGVRYRPGGGRIGVTGEGRWHSNFTRSGNEGEQLGFYTMGVGVSLLR